MKNFNDTIGNRPRDLPTCSAVPQPTAIQRAAYKESVELIYYGMDKFKIVYSWWELQRKTTN